MKNIFNFNPYFDTGNKWPTKKEYLIFCLTIFCFTLSLTAQNPFFVSSNTQQAVGVFDVNTEGAIT
ncbi:MAG: hypothetical protein AB8G86_21350, partial [Saprospiraceae bacterium]